MKAIHCFCTILILAMSASTVLAEPGYDIIITMGQSNAMSSGLGPYVDDYASPEVDAKISYLSRYVDDIRIKPIPTNCADGDGITYWTKSDCQPGRGFAIPFARRYVTNHLVSNRQVVILPAARGATSVLDWLGEKVRWPQSPLLYSDMVGRTRYVLSLPGSRIVALAIGLGEADTGYCSTHRYHMSQMKFRDRYGLLIRRIRDDLSQKELYPITAQKMVPSWKAEDSCKAEIETEIQRVRNVDSRYEFVSTNGLRSNLEAGVGSDAKHFSAQSMVELGARHYARWRQLMGY